MCVCFQSKIGEQKEKGMGVSEVCVTLYSMCFQKPLGVKPSSNAINSMMGNGSFRATGLCKHTALGSTRTQPVFYLNNESATNEEVAFCACFICRSIREVRSKLFALVSPRSQRLFSTHDCDLIRLITTIILLPRAPLSGAGHAHKHTSSTSTFWRLKL